jgi:hypothetical protein
VAFDAMIVGSNPTPVAKRNTMILNDFENASAATFIKKHRCNPKATRITQITVTPTGIADNIMVKCMTCGKEKDVSDYKSW